MFDAINETMKKELVNEYIMVIKREFLVEDFSLEADLCKYEVKLQEQRFVTYMTDEELKKAAEYAIDVLEELKSINNSGIDKNALTQFENEIEEKTNSDVMRLLFGYKKIESKKIKELIKEIENFRRVGGAYAMFIATPSFLCVIYSVYAAVVDRFDDEEMYWQSGIFLCRGIMKMHSEEISEN